MAEAAEDAVDPNAPDIDAQQAEADERGEAETPAETSAEEERIAQSLGWKPPKDWQGDKTNFMSAKDYLAQIPKTLENTREAIRRRDDKLARVVAEVAKLSANQRQQADADLDARMDAAIEAGDVAGARKIRDEMKRAAAPEPSEPSAFTDFKARNDWYGVDDIATAAVAALDRKFAAEAGGPDKVRDPDAHFRKIEAEMTKRFPDLFDGATTPRPAKSAPIVSRGGRVDGRPASGALTVADLNSAQRRAAAEMGVKPEDYVKSLNKINSRQSA